MTDFTENIKERYGLFKNVPRFLRRAVENRLQALEAEQAEFDRAALEHHGRLKRLHALLHIKPGERGRAALFGKPPADSPRAALKQLKRGKPAEAAQLVREHGLTYHQAATARGKVEPEVAVALVETMTGKDLLASLQFMARRGLIAGDVRATLIGRLNALAVEGQTKATYQQLESIVRRAELDRQVSQALFSLLSEAPVTGQLRGATALLVDVSSSMPRTGGCLELAAEVGWRIDRTLEREATLLVYLFGDEGSYAHVRRGSGLDQWRSTFTVPPPAIPGTSVGAALEKLRQDQHDISRLVLITDGFENRPPRFVSAYEKYRSATGLRPTIHLIQPAGATVQLASDMRRAQIPFGVFTMDQHLLGLEALMPALVSQVQEDRIAQIMAFC